MEGYWYERIQKSRGLVDESRHTGSGGYAGKERPESEVPTVKPEVKTVGEFIELVELMREAQKAFFESNGNRTYLQKAYELEKRVDACIKARRERERQPELVKEEA